MYPMLGYPYATDYVAPTNPAQEKAQELNPQPSGFTTTYLSCMHCRRDPLDLKAKVAMLGGKTRDVYPFEVTQWFKDHASCAERAAGQQDFQVLDPSPAGY